MTSATGSKNPAYKTQWDPVVGDIRDATRIGVNLSRLCLDYLFGKTVFRGIPEFLSYFDENESLDVPAREELAIWDISALDHTLEPEHPMMTSARQNQEISRIGLHTLEALLSAKGKAAELRFPKGGENLATVRKNREFSLIMSLGYTLKTTRGDLHIRITDLYRTMMACGIRMVKFAPQQKVTVLCAHVELEQLFKGVGDEEKVAKVFLSVFSPLAPPGMVWNLKADEVALKDQTYMPSDIHGVQLSGDKLELSIREKFKFEGLREFRERLLLEELAVPPNQKLVIEDVRFRLLVQEYEKIKNSGLNFIQFMFNQALLPIAEMCLFKRLAAEDALLDFSLRNDRLEVSSPTGFILKKEKGFLLANLRLLGDLMISEKRSSVSFGPNQSVYLYDLSEDEREMIRPAISNGNGKEITQVMPQILLNRNPLGFGWILHIQPGFEYINSTLRASEMVSGIYALQLVSPEGFTLSLERPSAEVFIRNIVNHSHPALLSGLRDADGKAMMFLLFRAFFYYLCQDFRTFRSYEFPTFFRPEERRLLVPNPQGRMQTDGVDPVIVTNDRGEVFQFVDESTVTRMKQKRNDPQLEAAIKEVNSVDAYAKKIPEICQMSPEEFDALSLDKLPAPIQVILKEIRTLAEKEMRKSPFIHTHLPAFLASLAPEEASASDKSTDKKDGDKKM